VLAALAPRAGVRMIAEMFNRKFAITRRMTVGKSYVATALKEHRLTILRLRRSSKNRIPREMPKNWVWCIDLTTITDGGGVQHFAFGVIDHGSRLSIALELIGNKRTTTLLWILLRCFAKFGKPHVIRADNESCFKSRLMRTTLAALGVKLQHSTPLSPWENGRIERFFGTLKNAISTALVPSMSVHAQLQWFRNYYHVRPHQHLAYRTPMEAWTGIERQCGDTLADFWEARFYRPA
jgi:transposase InsO family protein